MHNISLNIFYGTMTNGNDKKVDDDINLSPSKKPNTIHIMLGLPFVVTIYYPYNILKYVINKTYNAIIWSAHNIQRFVIVPLHKFTLRVAKKLFHYFILIVDKIEMYVVDPTIKAVRWTAENMYKCIVWILTKMEKYIIS